MADLKLNSLEQFQESETSFQTVFDKAGVSVFVEDFTEVKKDLDQLRAQGVHDFRAYFNQHPEFVRRAISKVRIVDVNNESVELFRAESKSDLLGSLAKIFLPETEPMFVEELIALSESREVVKAEIQLQTLKGRPIYALFTIHFGQETSDYSHVIVTLTDITERKAAEEALAGLNKTLETRVNERTQQVRDLIGRLTTAEQEERRRIAHILHDDLQQILSAIEIKLYIIQEAFPSLAYPELSKDLWESSEQLKRAITITRQLSVELSPPLVNQEGLVDALKWLADQINELHKLKVVIEAEGDFLLADNDLQVMLFQIIRELLFNVKKHSGVDKAVVGLWEQDGFLVIRVSDEGRGFSDEEKERALKRPGGFGLFNIQERLRLIGGRIEIHSTPNKGAKIELYVPTSVHIKERRS